MSEELKDLEKSMLQCQSRVYQDLHTLAQDVHKTVGRVGLLEIGHAEIKETLKVHESQRRGMHEKLEGKIDLVINHLAGVKADTDENKEFIDTLKKYWGRITFVSVGIGSTIGGIYWLYTFLQKHGLVIIFEKGAG